MEEKKGAFVGIIKNGKILLGLKKVSSGKLFWELPGGKVEEGETPEEAAKREALEEAGIKIRSLKLIGVKNEAVHTGETELVYYFISTDFEKGRKTDEEFLKTKFFSIEEIEKMPNPSWHLIDFLSLMRTTKNLEKYLPRAGFEPASRD